MRTPKTVRAAGLGLLLLSLSGHCAPFADDDLAGGPFKISAQLAEPGAGDRRLLLSVSIPEGHYLYADRFEVRAADPVRLDLKSGPESHALADAFTGSESLVYSDDFRMEFLVSNMESDALSVTVSYHGCGTNVCFMPASRVLEMSVAAGAEAAVSKDVELSSHSGGSDIRELLPRFETAARRTGYMDAGEFLEFLESVNKPSEGRKAGGAWKGGPLWLSLLGIILGGLALNLTPCVLPMIPVNIAIIGAGTHSLTRARGFMLGGFYGLGMAAAYGAAGAIVVLTGAMFGAVNASPWFNIGIAVLFLALGLAMFDVFALDFTRFLGTSGGRRRGLRLLAVLIMGAVSALLAGACVAPVVIVVLVHSASLFAGGARVGLVLPFLLGLGMALPWPFVGAGLSVLPKPGGWMTRVKAAFGVIILAASVYYAFEGARILAGSYASGVRQAKESSASDVDSVRLGKEDENIWITSLSEGLDRATKEGKPVLIDFWASWCKSCVAMDATTFRNPDVRARLEDFVAVKYRSETPGQPPHKQILEAFEVLGLPTYVILRPKDLGKRQE